MTDISNYCAACECDLPHQCPCTHTCGIDNDAARDAAGEQPSDPRYRTYAEKSAAAEITFTPMTDAQIDALTPEQVRMWVRDCERFRDASRRYRKALKEIASEDYRGNRPQSSVTAYYALHPEEKP